MDFFQLSEEVKDKAKTKDNFQRQNSKDKRQKTEDKRQKKFK
jgi:hypothetical protein